MNNNSVPRSVPWTSWNEWKQVNKWLLSDSTADKIHALKRISAWECRGHLSASIRSTADFVELRLEDQKTIEMIKTGWKFNHNIEQSEKQQKEEWRGSMQMNENEKKNNVEKNNENGHEYYYDGDNIRATTTSSTNISESTNFNYYDYFFHSKSENEKRLQYSMALNRFIHGLTLPFQTGKYAKSIFKICTLELKLPYEIVRLRHEASHGRLPNCGQLKWASQECLIWLRENYWMAQEKYLEDIREHIIQSLRQYYSMQKDLTSDVSGRSLGMGENELIEKCSIILDGFCENMSYNHVIEILLPTLVEKNLLVPKKMKQLTRKYNELPSRLKTMWLKALDRFIKKWPYFLPILLIKLVCNIFETCKKIPSNKKISDEKLLKSRYKISLYRCWFEFLLEMYYKTSGKVKNNSFSNNFCYNNFDSNLPFKTIMIICFKHINKQAYKIITKLINFIPPCEDRDVLIDKIKQLFHFHSRTLNVASEEVAYISGYFDSFSPSCDANRIIVDEKLNLEDFEYILNNNNNNNDNNNSNNTATNTTMTNIHWQLVTDELFPGYGIEAETGEHPNDLELPLILDEYIGPLFLIRDEDFNVSGNSSEKETINNNNNNNNNDYIFNNENFTLKKRALSSFTTPDPKRIDRNAEISVETNDFFDDDGNLSPDQSISGTNAQCEPEVPLDINSIKSKIQIMVAIPKNKK